MILKYYVNALEDARKGLTNARKCVDEAEKIYNSSADSLANDKARLAILKADIADNARAMSSFERVLETIWEKNPFLKERIDILYKKHYQVSKECSEHKEMADKLFHEGDISSSKFYRKQSLHEKDLCIRLQDEIAQVEDIINESLAREGQEMTYRDYRIMLTKSRRQKKELQSSEIRLAATSVDANNARCIIETCMEQYRMSQQYFNDSWQMYYEVVMSIANVPLEYRDSAKVAYQKETNQTKIIFGESSDTDNGHGHIQVDNTTGRILYYRLPGQGHGSQHFVGYYIDENPSKTSAE